MASLKQWRQLAGGCGCALFGRAVAQEFHEHAHGRAAEGMAEQMDAPLRGPVRQHGFRERLAKAVVAFFFRMGNAVVDRGTGQVRVQFARAVPGGAERRHRRGVDLIALLPHAPRVVAGHHAPVREALVKLLVLSPAHHAVDEDVRMLFGRHKNTSFSSFDICRFHYRASR